MSWEEKEKAQLSKKEMLRNKGQKARWLQVTDALPAREGIWNTTEPKKGDKGKAVFWEDDCGHPHKTGRLGGGRGMHLGLPVEDRH